MPTFNEECQRLHKAAREIGNVIWQEWGKTTIGRLLMRILKVDG